MKEILRDSRAFSFPMTIGIVLSLIILMCGISEYFRLQVIAAGVREAVEDAVISTVNDNYAGVYHGVREGYSGSYVPFGEGSWEEDLNEGDIYDYLDETIGTQLSGGRHVKYADTGTAQQRVVRSSGQRSFHLFHGGLAYRGLASVLDNHRFLSRIQDFTFRQMLGCGTSCQKQYTRYI